MADDKDPEIADAYALFGDEAGVPKNAPARPPSPRLKAPPEPDTFDLEGGPIEDEADAVVPPAPIPTPTRRARPAKVEEESRAPKVAKEEHFVDEVWSRGAEWGSTLILLAAVGFAWLFLVYSTFSADHLSRSFLVLIFGGAIWVALTYPIVITLERPVRMTPEQALKDYFAAASHHFPHYRRMWLLLSATGRSAPEFDSFPAFRDYWKSRMKQLRGDRVKPMTPLAFRVEEFKSDKSAGVEFVEAKYRVEVSPRGSESGSVLDSVRFDTSLVRGPDKMWYLNEGRLPASRS